jgi:hypothetical protein
MRRLLASACLAFSVACGASPTAPSADGPFRLTVSASRSVIPAGETATITFRLQNVGSGPQTLHFGDACQLMPYVANGLGLIVYPQGGGWGCATVITSLTLAPGEVKTEEVHVGSAAQGPDRYVQLGAGQYSAYAKVPSSEYRLQSEALRFTVR